MVIVTDCAKDELKKVLSANIAEPEIGLRLVPSITGQLGLMPDEERENDQVIEHGGSKVLLIGEDLSGALEGVTLDCRETSDGMGLVIVPTQEAFQ